MSELSEAILEIGKSGSLWEVSNVDLELREGEEEGERRKTQFARSDEARGTSGQEGGMKFTVL